MLKRLNDRTRVDGFRRFLLAMCCAVLASFAVVTTLTIEPASAVPSFARQTGQPCAACHTAFPELTPFGRRFKLNGYTMQGGDSNLPAFAAMLLGSYNNTQKGQSSPPAPATKLNDNFFPDQASIFYGGQIYGNVGAFVQATYSRASTKITWDNTDIRYADQTKIGDTNLTYGLTVHNNPTVQDVWNTTPAWGFPYAASSLGPKPGAATMIEGNFAAKVAGVGAYTFWNDMIYAELTGYQSLSPAVLSNLGIDSSGSDALKTVSPYWRLAIEPNWGNHSLELGTFGMTAQIYPGNQRSFGANQLTDLGFDAQYQYIADVHALSFRLSNIYEFQHLSSAFAQSNTTQLNNYLNSFKASTSYTYDNTYSATVAYFNISGSNNFDLYNINGNAAANGAFGGFSNTSSPNSDGFIFEVAYLPFSHGSPEPWPWANARIGLQYTIFDRFNGSSSNYDGAGRNARDNNTLYLYAWLAY